MVCNRYPKITIFLAEAVCKVEIQETEIKLEEHNGLFLYRTFWKGKKPHNRTPRRTRKDKKAS